MRTRPVFVTIVHFVTKVLPTVLQALYLIVAIVGLRGHSASLKARGIGLTSTTGGSCQLVRSPLRGVKATWHLFCLLWRSRAACGDSLAVALPEPCVAGLA